MTQQTLTIPQLIDLSHNLQKEHALMGARNSIKSLQSLIQQNLAFWITKNESVVAFVALHPTGTPNVFEFGSLWVHADWRGQGLSTHVAQHAFDYMNHLHHEIKQGKETHHVFVITFSGNPKVVHITKKLHNFSTATHNTWDTIPFSESCGVCDRFNTDEERLNCPFKTQANQCTMLFKTWEID